MSVCMTPLFLLAVLSGAAHAQTPEPPAPPPATVAPWRLVDAWDRAPSDRREGAWRVRLGVSGGASSNPLRLSTEEQKRFALADSGYTLRDPGQPWPMDSVAGVPLGMHVAAGWSFSVLDAPTSLTAAWDGRVLLRSPNVADSPLRVALSTTLRAGQGPHRGAMAPRGEAWVTMALLANPHAYDRPLPRPDPALHDPLPDTWIHGVRRSVGGELAGGWTPATGLTVGPLLRAQVAQYPRGLESWSASLWDAGARVRWLPVDLLFVEARGGFASEIAAGDDPSTTRREVDPSWAGTRWGLDVGVDTSGLYVAPFRAVLGADLVQRNFRTGDGGDLAHYGRRDVGLAARALGAWVPPLQGPWGAQFALSLAYTLDWNHTNLPRNVVPPDAGDFVNHTGTFAVHLGHHGGVTPR